MSLPISKTGLPAILQNVAVQYRNPLYVADRVFPVIDNCPPEAKIARYLKGAWFRDEAGQRGPSGEAVRGGYPIDYINVVPQEYAFAKEVPDEDREVAGAMNGLPFSPDEAAISYATDKLLMKREIRTYSLIAASVWSGIAASGTDAAGTWAAGAGNTFLADIKAKKAVIQGNTGLMPNCLLIDGGTYMSLTEESTILSKIQYTQRGVLTADLLAAILDLEEVIVAYAVKNTAKENKAGSDFTAAKIWEYNATKGMGFLFYRAPIVGLNNPSAGYIARSGATPGGIKIQSWREESKHQDVYEASEKIDIVAAGLDLGYMWKDTLLT